MTMMISLGVFLLILLILFVLRKVLSLFASAILFFVATVGYLQFGFDPPLPMSVKLLYVATLIVALLLYVTSSESGKEDFLRPIMAVILNNKLLPLRLLFLLIIPGLIAWQSYEMTMPSEVPPPRIRQIHPPPPSSVAFSGPEIGHYDPPPKEGKEPLRHKAIKLDMVTADNPLRALQSSSPDEFREHLKNGKAIYYQNCYFCHGDHLMADGHFASSVKPPPANFQDSGTLPMLQESFLFWRISKGAPGLPDAATPWDSTMPAWEKMLTEEEIWEVILFLYDHTGFQPRRREEAH